MQLDDKTALVLGIVLERGMIRGAELMRSAGVKRANELVTPLLFLQDKKMVEVKGDFLEEDKLPFATLSVRPSDKEYLHGLLAKHRAM